MILFRNNDWIIRISQQLTFCAQCSVSFVTIYTESSILMSDRRSPLQRSALDVDHRVPGVGASPSSLADTILTTFLA